MTPVTIVEERLGAYKNPRYYRTTRGGRADITVGKRLNQPNDTLMDNPWPQLPIDAPHVLPSDRCIVEKFNARNADKHFIVQTQLLPEPFIGDPNARVYLLNLNPGYTPGEDDEWHADPAYRTAIIDNLSHRPAEFPLYFLDPRLKDAPGSKWWRKYARWLIDDDDIGIEKLARNLFCVELFPYHSTKYRPVPRVLSPNRLVPSSAYGFHLVRRAIRTGRPIVATRRFEAWCAQIPKLRGYANLFRLRTTASVWLSPDNIEGYDRLVDELRAAP